jgi:hypothetical protein
MNLNFESKRAFNETIKEITGAIRFFETGQGIAMSSMERPHTAWVSSGRTVDGLIAWADDHYDFQHHYFRTKNEKQNIPRWLWEVTFGVRPATPAEQAILNPPPPPPRPSVAAPPSPAPQRPQAAAPRRLEDVKPERVVTAEPRGGNALRAVIIVALLGVLAFVGYRLLV